MTYLPFSDVLPEKFAIAWEKLLRMYFMVKVRRFNQADYTEWEKLVVDSQHALTEAFKSELCPNGKKFSTDYQNTHIIREHLVSAILFLGPVAD